MIDDAKLSFNLSEPHDLFREGMYVRYYNHALMRWDRLWIQCRGGAPDGQRDTQYQGQAGLHWEKSWLAPPSSLDAQALAVQEEWLTKLECWDIWTAPLLQTSQLLDFCRQELCKKRSSY
ncbi:hypothetical protein ACK31R_19095 [Aeromonas caviae]